jgi:conjugal transfer ATP-binding protein TraC
MMLSDISTQLDKFAQGGAYARYFAGIPTIDFSNDFIVLELEELKNKKDLGSVVLLIMMYRITEEMYRMGRERRKLVLIDEAYDLLDGGAAAGTFIGAGYRRARKYNGAFGTATQSINDYYANAASTAALENADWQFILRQKEETIAALAKSDRLVMGEAMKRVLLSMRKVDGEYSEVFVKCPVGQGLMRFIVDPHSLLLYSSKGEDFIAIAKLRDQGLTIEQAVEQVLTDRGQTQQQRTLN